ncbi:retrovirus-related pol polyprotein from transposon TNT 1-94 [Tanacetum coccineum]
MNQFCGMKGIKREFSVTRTPQQNGVAKRKNRTLIEAARTMLADSLLPTIFWAEALVTLVMAMGSPMRWFTVGYSINTKAFSTVSPSINTAGQSFTNADDLSTDPLMAVLEDTADLLNTDIFNGAYNDEDVGAEAELNNLETTMNISEELAMVSYIKNQRRTNHKDYQNCLVAYFLSQIEPKKVTQALQDPSWIEAMQDELLQFSLQKVWRLVDLPKGKHAIGTKWVHRNKKDERRLVVRNKARLVAQDKFKFFVDEEEVTFSVDDFRTLFQLPQATENNHAEFEEPPELLTMLAFLTELGYAKQIRLARNFMTTDLPQPWQTLRKILMRYLTTRETSVDQPQLHMMQMKKKGRGMRIPEWLLTEKMKQTTNYKVYATDFQIAIPMTQSQPTESTQGMNMTPSALMSPNAQEQQGESSALKKSTIIKIPRRKQPHPATHILTAEKINVDNLDEATQIRIAIARSAEEYKAQQAIKKVDEHLMDEDIKKLVEGEYSKAII